MILESLFSFFLLLFDALLKALNHITRSRLSLFEAAEVFVRVELFISRLISFSRIEMMALVVFLEVITDQVVCILVDKALKVLVLGFELQFVLLVGFFSRCMEFLALLDLLFDLSLQFRITNFLALHSTFHHSTTHPLLAIRTANPAYLSFLRRCGKRCCLFKQTLALFVSLFQQ